MIGAGRVGTALAVHWLRAGHEIVAVSGREQTAVRAAEFLAGVPVMDAAAAARAAEVVVLGVPDHAIAETCSALASAGVLGKSQTVVHLSGATSLRALATAQGAGASVLCLHPLQTFPTVEAAVDRIPSSAIAVTAPPGDTEATALGERLVADARARAFTLPDDVKPLYHAAAVFASNYLVAVIAEAEQLFRGAGLPDPIELFMPLARASLENVASLGPEAALTGPAVRGDAGTVAGNLEALAANSPQAIPAYVALAQIALDLAERSGRLSAEARQPVEEVLSKWR